MQESPFFTRTEPIPGLGASPEVSEQAFTLETGKVSGPLRTGTGVAFLTVTGSRGGAPPHPRGSQGACGDRPQTAEGAGARARQGAGDGRRPEVRGRFRRPPPRPPGSTLRTANDLARGAAIPEVGPSPAVDQVAFSLPVGSVSDPITTTNGAVVVKVASRADVPAADIAKNRDAIRRELASQKRAQFFASYMTKAKQGMGISIDQAVLQRLTT